MLASLRSRSHPHPNFGNPLLPPLIRPSNHAHSGNVEIAPTLSPVLVFSLHLERSTQVVLLELFHIVYAVDSRHSEEAIVRTASSGFEDQDLFLFVNEHTVEDRG